MPFRGQKGQGANAACFDQPDAVCCRMRLAKGFSELELSPFSQLPPALLKLLGQRWRKQR